MVDVVQALRHDAAMPTHALQRALNNLLETREHTKIQWTP